MVETILFSVYGKTINPKLTPNSILKQEKQISQTLPDENKSKK